MLYQHPTEFTYDFKVIINNSNYQEIITVVDASEVLKEIAPRYSANVTASMFLANLQANYYLPSLKRNPYPDIDDLAPETQQTAQIIEHKTKYTPDTGHAIEISFYKAFLSNHNWSRQGRDYFYNLGLIEQYLPLLSPYFSLAEEVPLGKSKIGISVTQGALGPDDYIVIHGNLRGTISCFFLPDVNLHHASNGGEIKQDAERVSNAKKRSTFMLTNGGPGRLYFAPSNHLASSKRCAWLEPGNTFSWEGADFDISYTGNNANINLFKLGGLIPDSEIWVSSDSIAEWGYYESYLN